MEEIIEEDSDIGGEVEDISSGKDDATKSDIEEGRLFDLAPLYEELERGYDRAVEEVRVRGAELVKFFKEYKRMWEVLYLYQDNEKKLLRKNRELQQEVTASAAQVADAIKVSQADKNTVKELKKELESAWKMVDAAHCREHAAQEMIENLRTQVTKLSKDTSRKPHHRPEQESELGSMGKTRDSLVKERDRLFKEVSVLKEKLSSAMQYQEELERKNSAADIQVEQLMGELESRGTEVAKECLARERLELEVRDMMQEMSNKDTELISTTKELQQMKQLVKELEKSVKEQKMSHEKLVQDIEVSTGKFHSLQQEYDKLGKEIEKLTSQLSNKSVDLRAKDDEIAALQVKATKSIRIQESYVKKLRHLEKKQRDVEAEKSQLNSKIKILTLQVHSERRQLNAGKRKMENLKKKRDIINKNMAKFAESVREQEENIKTQKHVTAKLEHVIDKCTAESAVKSDTILNLEKEQDRYIKQSFELSQNIVDIMNEMKMKEMEVQEHKKKLTEVDSKLKQQRDLFEAVRIDRNMLSKHLLESQDEISELKQKLRIMTHQIEQLKEDISSKDNQIMKAELVFQKTEKERDGLKSELQRTKEELRKCREDMQELQLQERKLQKVVQQVDDRNTKLQKDIEQAVTERDILGKKLMNQNEELSVLCERMKVTETALKNGELQYEQRLDDIRLLKLEVKKLRQEKGLLSQNITNMADMKEEVFHLERDLTKERIKCKALEEELQVPMNVHRWRKLEGSDPETYELMKKIQLLQKRILAQSSSALEREAKLQETQKLYLNLRELLERQPGPEIIERMQKMQRVLHDRGQKMKCLLTEVNMYESQASEYKFDLEKVTEELRDVKKKYMKQKSQERRRRELSAPPVIVQSRNDKCQFTGGGFNLNAIPSKLLPSDAKQ